VCLAALGFSAPASALGPGDFDPSFGSGGKVVAPLGLGASPFSFARGAALQGDGKIVTVGTATDSTGTDAVLVMRLTPDGTLDSSFGVAGKVIYQFGAGGNASEATAVTVQSDGKIAFTGYAQASNGNWQLLVGRLNADGSLDSSFDSTGTVITQIGTGTADEGEGVAIDANHKVVVDGYADDSTNRSQLMVVRLTPDGHYDPSFDSTGKVVTQVGVGPGPVSDAYALALQGDGKIVVAGDASDATRATNVLVARLNADGTFDSTFGTAGKVVKQLGSGASPRSFAGSIALQGDGRIVVAGDASDSSTHPSLLVARLTAGGSFDSSFGSSGAVTTQMGVGATPYTNGSALGIQSNGKLVVAGDATDSSGRNQFLVARLNPDGGFDSAFGSSGRVLTQLGGGATPFSGGDALVLQGDGKVVVAGDATNGTGMRSVLVARLIGDLPSSVAFKASPNPVGVGRPVVFDGSASSDPDGIVVSETWNFGDGATASGLMASHVYRGPGTYNVTLTVTDDDAVTASTTEKVTVLAPTHLSRVFQTVGRWRRGNALPHVAHKRRPPVGTTFGFTLNEAARVTFAFTQTLPGRRVGRRCVAQTKRNKHKRRCSRTLTAGTLTFAGHAGANKVRFQGRLSRSKRLKPGRYTLIITATNAAGQRATARLTFTIVTD
jgi:uncharacterized delta-60 repeat protein